jgi:hypothetical protein
MSALEIPASPLPLPTLLSVEAVVRLPHERRSDYTSTRRNLTRSAQNLHDLRTDIKLSASRHLEKLAHRFCGGLAGVLK